ncbi:MAG TPA: NAD(P)H-binding protein [Candidatus Thermoplasmatota archaeon]|nr:NAD(P)H-binding protein [Candidatus Thermoplasmatota archaeon]
MVEPFDVVTGAFGQTGHEIARVLQGRGRRLKTITRAPAWLGVQAGIPVIPPAFHDPVVLTETLRGCGVLYSAYWSRFPIRGSYQSFVDNARVLFSCARRAGVRRIVQVSVAHAERDLPHPYWQGKARLEAALRDSGVPYSILRPALIFGAQDTLVNNLTWVMRHAPVLPIPGRGDYRVRPVFVEDLAALAVAHGALEDNVAVAAVGPEVFRYIDFVRRVRDAVGSRCIVLPFPLPLVWLGAKAMSPLVHDTLLTWSELQGLRAGWYDVDGPATCPTRLTEWLAGAASILGTTYHSQRLRAQAKEWPGRVKTE